MRLVACETCASGKRAPLWYRALIVATTLLALLILCLEQARARRESSRKWSSASVASAWCSAWYRSQPSPLLHC